MSIIIIKDFLPKNEFETIQKMFLGPRIPWFFNSCIVDLSISDSIENRDVSIEDLYDYQFTHMLYQNYTICSEFFQLLDPILTKLNPSAILRIKSNLIPRSDKIIEFPLHIDITHFKGKTAIFYINSNDGYTLFQDGTKVESIENQIVIFDSTTMHTGTTCTNQKNRCVINFNFYQWNFI